RAAFRTLMSATIRTIASTRWLRSDSMDGRIEVAPASTEVTLKTPYRASRAALLKWSAIDVGPKSAVPGAMSPIILVRRVTNARAAGDGVYRSCVIACSTRCLVAGRTLGESFITRETV